MAGSLRMDALFATLVASLIFAGLSMPLLLTRVTLIKPIHSYTHAQGC